MSGPRSINIVSIFLFVFFGLAAYASYQIIPVLWINTQLEDLIKEESYGAKRKDEAGVQRSIIDSAKILLEINLKEEEVQVKKFTDRVKINVYWNVMFHFFKEEIPYNIHIYKETVFF